MTWVDLYEGFIEQTKREPPAFYTLIFRRRKILFLIIVTYPIFVASGYKYIAGYPTSTVYFHLCASTFLSAMIFYLGIIIGSIFKDYLGLTGVLRIEVEYFRMSLIFKDRESFHNYAKKEIYRVITPSSDLKYAVISGIIGYTCFLDILPNYIAKKNIIEALRISFCAWDTVYRPPLTIIGNVVFKMYLFIFWIIIASSILFVLRVIISLKRLHKFYDDFAITSVLDMLETVRYDIHKIESGKMYERIKGLFERGRYNIFLKFADSVASFLARISIIVISFALIYNLSLFIMGAVIEIVNIYWFYTMILYGLVLIILGILIFMLPQIFLYRILKRYKHRLITLLESIYEISFLKFMTTDDPELRSKIINDVREVETAIDYAKKIRSLPFGLMQLAKIIGIIIIWIQMGLLQFILFFF